MNGLEKRKALAKAYVAEVRSYTFCDKCGKQSIDWHCEAHLEKPNARVAHQVARGEPVIVIQREIDRCTPLCRGCHMREDGRLAKLRENCPNQKGAVLTDPRPCL